MPSSSLEVSDKKMNSTGFQNYLGPHFSTHVIKIGTVRDDQINKCEEISVKYSQLSYVPVFPECSHTQDGTADLQEEKRRCSECYPDSLDPRSILGGRYFVNWDMLAQAFC